MSVHILAHQAPACAPTPAQQAYDAAWARWDTLMRQEDVLLAHNDPPYSLDLYFTLDGLRRELAYAERDLDRCQAALRGAPSPAAFMREATARIEVGR